MTWPNPSVPQVEGFKKIRYLQSDLLRQGSPCPNSNFIIIKFMSEYVSSLGSVAEDTLVLTYTLGAQVRLLTEILGLCLGPFRNQIPNILSFVAPSQLMGRISQFLLPTHFALLRSQFGTFKHVLGFTRKPFPLIFGIRFLFA